MPTSHSRRSLRVLLALSVVLAVVLSGCYQDPNPTDYGDAAKANFIEGCTEDVDAKGGTTTVVTIQTKSVCECIYELIESPGEGEKGKYPIDWDDLTAYEAKQAAAKAGDLPEPPKNLTKVIEECKPSGPGL